MASIKKKLLTLAAIGLLSFSHLVAASSYSVIATHDQNPLLISYWIPHSIAPNDSNELQVSTSLFITNTLHDESKSNEKLIIDSETYRFDLNLQFEKDQWVYHAQIPFISSNGGFMDEFIIKWHDVFSLPQGHRLMHTNDQLNLRYDIDNKSLIDTQGSYQDIGDISLVAVHPISFNNESTWYIGFGVNIPSGSNKPLISNQTTDSAIWLSYLPSKNPLMLTLGLIKPGNNGIFKDRLNSSLFFAQSGFEISISTHIKAQLQFDYHSSFINSSTAALGASLQIQIGILLTQFENSDIQLFFSEDILVGSAPDITFGLQMHW